MTNSPLHALIEALAECAANRPNVIFRLADPAQVAFYRASLPARRRS